MLNWKRDLQAKRCVICEELSKQRLLRFSFVEIPIAARQTITDVENLYYLQLQ
jgi:hypothetical protein